MGNEQKTGRFLSRSSDKEETIMEEKKYTLDDLVQVIRILRGENGCPWDRVPVSYTHLTLPTI